jgi:hypothetical protein
LRRRRDLKLHRPLRLLLHNDCPSADPITVADLAHPMTYQIAAAQVAVVTQVEHGELSQSSLHLQTNPDGPDLLEFERGLLADQLAFVPWFVTLILRQHVKDAGRISRVDSIAISFRLKEI